MSYDVSQWSWNSLDLSKVTRISPEAAHTAANVFAADPEFMMLPISGELRNHIWSVGNGKYLTKVNDATMKQVLMWLQRVQKAFVRWSEARIDVWSTNLKDVDGLTFSQLRSIAVQLHSYEHFDQALVHQQRYWLAKTGEASNFNWASDLIADVQQGDIDHASEQLMRQLMAAARVLQSQFNLYEKFLKWSAHQEMVAREEVTREVPVVKPTNQQRRKAEARKMAKLRRESGQSRGDVSKKGRK